MAKVVSADLEILKHPNPELAKVSDEVTVFNALLDITIDAMATQMYQENGIGLAAPQVGIHKRIIIVDVTAGEDASQFYAMINPRITSSSGTITSEEGCLSIPGVRGEVERFAQVSVSYQTTTGEQKTLTTSGMLAIAIQHEIDHLDGVLFIDRIKGIRKLTMRKYG